MACQKMANGFATTEELAGKAGVLVSHEGTMGTSLGPLEECAFASGWGRAVMFFPLSSSD